MLRGYNKRIEIKFFLLMTAISRMFKLEDEDEKSANMVTFRLFNFIITGR